MGDIFAGQLGVRNMGESAGWIQTGIGIWATCSGMYQAIELHKNSLK